MRKIVALVSLVVLMLAFMAPAMAALIEGNSKSNTLVGTQTHDNIRAKGGNDVVHARGGNDTVLGHTGNDRLYGEEGERDVLRGGAGDDKLYGGPGNSDEFYGGTGTDTCFVDGPEGNTHNAVSCEVVVR